MPENPFVDLKTAPVDLLDAVLALNAVHSAQTSALDGPALAALVSEACVARARPDGDAFVIAFSEGAAYDSPNYRWVCAHERRFVYVDRIVVARELQGRGVGRALYESVFAHASFRGDVPILCEVNAVPPNPGSDAFHAALGFVEVGRGAPSPGKEVRYLRRLPP